MQIVDDSSIFNSKSLPGARFLDMVEKSEVWDHLFFSAEVSTQSCFLEVGPVRLPIRLCCLFILSFIVAPAMAETTFFGPVTGYTSAADTPAEFICDLCDDCVTVLEDFEDGTLDHGIMLEAIDGQIIGPGFGTGLDGLTDSVDGDDGTVDGVGNEGYSYFSPGNSITITLPNAMKSVGFVWTDGDRNSMTTVEFYGTDGLLGTIGPVALADDSFQGTTAEDTFFGAQDAAGITSVVVTNVGGAGIEIDHIQYEDCSACVPEPASMLMGLFGLLGAMGWVRRKA